MLAIKIVAFKGCLPALDLHDKLQKFIGDNSSQFTLHLDVVSSLQLAEKMKLFGSPTIFVGRKEYQEERKGPAGFY